MANEIASKDKVQDEDECEEGEIKDDASLEDVSSADETTPLRRQKFSNTFGYNISFKDSHNYKSPSLSRQRNVPVVCRRKSRSHHSGSTDEDRKKKSKYRTSADPVTSVYHLRSKISKPLNHDKTVHYAALLQQYKSSKQDGKKVDTAQEKENREDCRDNSISKKNPCRKRRYSQINVSEPKDASSSSSSDTEEEVHTKRHSTVNDKKLKACTSRTERKSRNVCFKRKSSKETKEKRSSKKKSHKSLSSKLSMSIVEKSKIIMRNKSFHDAHPQENSLKSRLQAMLATGPVTIGLKSNDDKVCSLQNTKDHTPIEEINSSVVLVSPTMNELGPKVPCATDSIAVKEVDSSSDEIVEIPKELIEPEVITLDSDDEGDQKINSNADKLATVSETQTLEKDQGQNDTTSEAEGKTTDEDEDLLVLRRLALESNKGKIVGDVEKPGMDDEVLQLRLDALRSAYLRKHMERKQRGLTLKQKNKTTSVVDSPLSSISPLNSPTSVPSAPCYSPEIPKSCPLVETSAIVPPPPLPDTPPEPVPPPPGERSTEADETTAIVDMDLAHTDDERECCDSPPTLGEGFIVLSDSEAHQRDTLCPLFNGNQFCESMKYKEVMSMATNDHIVFEKPRSVDTALFADSAWNPASDSYKYSEVQTYPSGIDFHQYPETNTLHHNTISSRPTSLDFPQNVSPSKYFPNQHSSHLATERGSYFVPNSSEFNPQPGYLLPNENTEISDVSNSTSTSINKGIHIAWKQQSRRINLLDIPITKSISTNEIPSMSSFNKKCDSSYNENIVRNNFENLVKSAPVGNIHADCVQEEHTFGEKAVRGDIAQSEVAELGSGVGSILPLQETVASIDKTMQESKPQLSEEKVKISPSKIEVWNEESHIEPETMDLSSMIVLDEIGRCSSPEGVTKSDDIANSECLQPVTPNLLEPQIGDLDEDEQILRARVLTTLPVKHAKSTSSLELRNFIEDNSELAVDKIHRQSLPSKSQKSLRNQNFENYKTNSSMNMSRYRKFVAADVNGDGSSRRKQRPSRAILSNNYRNKKVNVSNSKSTTLSDTGSRVRYTPEVPQTSLQVTIPITNADKLVHKRKVAKSISLSPGQPPGRFVICLGTEDSDSGEEEAAQQALLNSHKRRYVVPSSSSMPPKAYSPLIMDVPVNSNLDSEASSFKPLLSHPQDPAAISTFEGRKSAVSTDFEEKLNLLLKQMRLQHEVAKPVKRDEVVDTQLSGSPKNKVDTRPVTEKSGSSAPAVDVSSSTPSGIRLLPSSKQEEYRRLKQQLALKEKQKQQQLSKKTDVSDRSFSNKVPGKIKEKLDQDRTISIFQDSNIRVNVINNTSLLKKPAKRNISPSVGRAKCKVEISQSRGNTSFKNTSEVIPAVNNDLPIKLAMENNFNMSSASTDGCNMEYSVLQSSSSSLVEDTPENFPAKSKRLSVKSSTEVNCKDTGKVIKDSSVSSSKYNILTSSGSENASTAAEEKPINSTTEVKENHICNLTDEISTSLNVQGGLSSTIELEGRVGSLSVVDETPVSTNFEMKNDEVSKRSKNANDLIEINSVVEQIAPIAKLHGVMSSAYKPSSNDTIVVKAQELEKRVVRKILAYEMRKQRQSQEKSGDETMSGAEHEVSSRVTTCIEQEEKEADTLMKYLEPTECGLEKLQEKVYSTDQAVTDQMPSCVLNSSTAQVKYNVETKAESVCERLQEKRCSVQQAQTDKILPHIVKCRRVAEECSEPTNDVQERLQENERNLLTQRYSVLDDLTEMMQQLREIELERTTRSECVAEMHRLRAELARAEERLRHQDQLVHNKRATITEAHKRMMLGRRRCAVLTRNCQDLGQRVVGTKYKVPAGGAELMKTKLHQFATYTRHAREAKRKGEDDYDDNAATTCILNSGQNLNSSCETSGSPSCDLPKVPSISASSTSEVSIVSSTCTQDSAKENSPLDGSNKDEKTQEDVKRLLSSASEALGAIVRDRGAEDKLFSEDPLCRQLPEYRSPLESLKLRTAECDPLAILCPFELMGSCQDEDCQYLHQAAAFLWHLLASHGYQTLFFGS